MRDNYNDIAFDRLHQAHSRSDYNKDTIHTDWGILMGTPTPQALSILLDENSGQLRAKFDPAGGVPPDLAIFTQALADHGWDGYYLDDDALDDFLVRCSTAKQPVGAIVGGRRDGTFSVRLAEDLMTAWLTLVPPQGGKAVDVAAVMAVLSDKGVVYGILHDEIKSAFAAGYCADVAIARGDMPQEGVACRFESLFDHSEAPAAGEDALADVEHSDLCHLLLVQPGDPLMRRIPAVTGKNGIDIKNQEIAAKQFPDVPFGNVIQGAALDQNDPDLLIAACAGQPMLTANGVSVNPVVVVPDVNLRTGNITFEGTLRVTGDVKAGMRLNVTGDVLIGGTVEAAEIVAGGNVVVSAGIIGHSDTLSGSHALPATTAIIRCEGSVQALFMENARIEAGDSIMIDRAARQCELIARNKIVVGKSGAAGGQISGGLAQAMMLVKATILGSSAGIKTRVQVGFDPFQDKKRVGKEQALKGKMEELDKVLKLLAFFEHNPKKGEGGVREKVERTRHQLVGDINQLTNEVNQLGDGEKAKDDSLDKAQVEVARMMHYGVEIRIGKQVWEAKDDMRGSTVKLDEEGKIVVRG